MPCETPPTDGLFGRQLSAGMSLAVARPAHDASQYDGECADDVLLAVELVENEGG